ncbi:hypothetical protein LTR04_003279 [Oleoguttula sp. CCFEE 6159]|nr:hypothetical protein LTR04_003279 [Oleoguttula sp. CCFEE 6159]
MTSIIKRAALTPTVTGTLLAILNYGPPRLRDPIMLFLQKNLSATNIRRLRTTLKWLFAIGIGQTLNRALDDLSLNNWNPTNQAVWNWSQEIAVVTGGSNGIGALVCDRLAAKGVKVVILDVVEPQKDISNNSGLIFKKCDITDPEAVKAVAEEIRRTVGKPSILINNAGIAHGHTILETSPEYLKKLFNVNFLSHYYTLQAFLPDMIAAKKGHVLATASMASFVSVAGLVDYCGTKSAVLSLHEGLAQELRHRYHAPQVRTSVIHPTWCRTTLIASYEDALAKAGEVVITPEEVADAIAKQIFSGRSGQIILGGSLGFLSGLRGWPTWVQEFLRNGSNKSVMQ